MNIPKYLILYRKELELKAYSENTIKNYVSQVDIFLKHYKDSFTEPSKINETAIKDWLLQFKTRNSMCHSISALKLFYLKVIKQPLKFKHIEYPRSEKKLPIVLSQDEVQRMFDVCENLKHKVILALLYSCGLRVSELLNLKWSNIDRSRNVINIIAAKGKKDRQVMLPETIVPLLINYYREYKTETYILAGQFSDQYSDTSVNQVMKQLAKKANIKKRVWTHQMRHNCFTHMVENGTDVNIIQKLAGHNNVKTTMMYVQISDSIISKINSPINQIRL